MKKVTNYITLKFISVALILLILTMSGIQVASMLKIKSDVFKIQTRWDEVQIEQSEKLRLENSIHTFLGFGGMIHKLKEAVINNNNESLNNIDSDLYSAETIIQLYLSFQLSSAENYALQDILTVVKQYQQKSELLKKLLMQGTPQHKLDQLLRIDDKPALQGLEVLKQYNRTMPEHHQHLAFVPSDKFVLLTDLVAALGYGGLIHHIKNLEIRGDTFYAQQSQIKIEEMRKILQEFNQLTLTQQEQHALKVLMETINSYQLLLTNLTPPVTLQQITDRDKLSQSDKNSQQALEILKQYIEIELKSKVIEVDNRIHHIQSSINNLIKLIILASIILLVLFSYIMFKRVIMPLQSVTASMVLLARQKHEREIYFNANQIFEINQMLRSIRIFKKNEHKRRVTQKSLTKMHDTTLQQLAEIQKLQNKSEQKTEQALSLANHLIELQKSAEFDRNNALENQRRVKTILNTVHDAIITTNKRGKIESINTATEAMFGYRESQLIGENITQLMPDALANNHPQILRDFNAKATPKLKKGSLEQQAKRSDGSIFPVEIFLGQSKFNGEIAFTAVIRDITQRKKDEEAIQHLVLTDPLTNLANRRHFNQELTRAMDSQKRLKLSVALLMIDLDNFKPINDTYGHKIGDKVLQRVASRLQNITRSVDLIARLGGDEFAIILNSVETQFDPTHPAQKIIETLSKPMRIDNQIVQVGTTIGIAIAPQDASEQEEFIHRADKALYKAKSLGKGQHFLYQHLSDEEK